MSKKLAAQVFKTCQLPSRTHASGTLRLDDSRLSSLRRGARWGYHLLQDGKVAHY